MKRMILLAALLASAPLAHAATGLTVTDAWMRALPGGVPAGGYFILHNDGGAAVTLTGAQSPACGMLMLHQSIGGGGMSGMRHISEVKVSPGEKLAFAPGSYHLMCMSPSLKPGNAAPVTLVFQDGTRLTVNFAVRNAAGKE
jgi:periplasmic copper chaperone A